MANKKQLQKFKMRMLFLLILLITVAVLLAERTLNNNKPIAATVNVTIIENGSNVSASKPVPSSIYPNFTEVYRFPGSSTNALLWADLDNNGWLDLVTGNFDDQIFVFYNKKENFSRIPLGVGKPRAIAAADFNNDKKIDLAAGSYGSDNILFINQGDGNFKQQVQFMELPLAENKVTTLAWADFNKDGYPDLAIGRDNQQNLFFINNGDGTFTMSKQFGIAHTTAMVWADINNDGYPDLIVGNYGDKSYIYLNNKTTKALLFNQIPFTEPGTNIRGIAVADFNIDGWPDIAVANYDQPSQLYLNNHDGTFNATAPLGTCLAVDIAAADFNNDGWPDAAIACYNGQSHIYYNNGNNTFVRVPEFGAGYTHNFAVADYNKDGAADIAVGRYGQTTSLYRNGLYAENFTHQ